MNNHIRLHRYLMIPCVDFVCVVSLWKGDTERNSCLPLSIRSSFFALFLGFVLNFYSSVVQCLVYLFCHVIDRKTNFLFSM